jgi:hypothetical protein
MALVAPLLILIMFVAAETGRYFYQEHVLVKAVRDGSVFAARAPIDRFNCTTSTIDPTVVTNTRALVRTGGLSGQTDLLPWWGATGASFTMTLACTTAADGVTLAGLYTGNGGKVPVITISATLPYQPMLSTIGLARRTLNLNASQQAAVLGI